MEMFVGSLLKLLAFSLPLLFQVKIIYFNGTCAVILNCDEILSNYASVENKIVL